MVNDGSQKREHNMTWVSAITLNTEVRTQKLVTLHGIVDVVKHPPWDSIPSMISLPEKNPF